MAYRIHFGVEWRGTGKRRTWDAIVDGQAAQFAARGGSANHCADALADNRCARHAGKEPGANGQKDRSVGLSARVLVVGVLPPSREFDHLPWLDFRVVRFGNTS